MTDADEYKHNLRALDKALRRSVESWWIATLLTKFSIFIVGTLAIFLSIISQGAPFIVVALSAVSEFCNRRSNSIRDTWETLHRELDAYDSFGWPVSRAEVSDLLIQSPRKLREQLSAPVSEEAYFASVQTKGAKRAIENMQESAWWSKHLARTAGNFYSAIITILIIGSIVLLILSIETIRDFDLLANIGRVVTSTL